MKRHGFSLVELSIVLVILGLLTGGILSGQSLIHAAELRSITTDLMRYSAAANAFRDKYFALPGDFNNAQAFWNAQGTNCSGTVTTLTTTGTCNGDGSGTIDNTAAASTTGERFQFWRHLALAGLIEGNYSGIAGSQGSTAGAPGTNIPASKISGGGWFPFTLNNYAGSAGTSYAGDYGNYLSFSLWSAGVGNAILKPEDMWNIDTKLDDGKPGTGKVIAFSYSTCTNAASPTDYGSTYNLSTSTVGCVPLFLKAF